MPGPVLGDRQTLGSLLTGFSTSFLWFSINLGSLLLLGVLFVMQVGVQPILPIPEQDLPQKPSLPWLVRREDGWVELQLHLNPWQGL